MPPNAQGSSLPLCLSFCSRFIDKYKKRLCGFHVLRNGSVSFLCFDGRDGSAKSYKVSPEKKPKKAETPIVIRRSLRTRGMPPDSNCLDADSNENSNKTTLNQTSINREKPSPCVLGPLKMKDAYDGTGSDREFMDTLLSFERKPKLGVGVKEEFDCFKVVKEEGHDRVLCGPVKRKVESDNLNCGIKIEKREFEGCVDLGSMSLEPENIARIMPGRIMTVRFFPRNDINIVAAGNKLGNVAFWNVDSEGEKGDGIFLYRPHTGPISGILFQQSCLSKVMFLLISLLNLKRGCIIGTFAVCYRLLKKFYR